MLKKIQRNIKEKVTKLPDDKVESIKEITNGIAKANLLLNMLVGAIAQVVGILFIIGLVIIGEINLIVAVFFVMVMLILQLISFCATKINKILLERDIKPEIQWLKDNSTEYTEVIPIEEKWYEYMEDIIHDMKVVVETVGEISHNAQIKPDTNTITIILKNTDDECIDWCLSLSSDTFVKIYKIPDMEKENQV